MAYDTVKLRSPFMDASLMARIEQQCILRSGLHLGTGEVLYELHAGELLGSWDSRIAIKPMHEEHVADKNGRVAMHPCVRIPRDGGHDSMLMADSVPA